MLFVFNFFLPLIIFKFFIFIYFNFVSFSVAVALNCYQCSGTDTKAPFQCNEALSSDIDIEPVSCDNVFGAKYCVKHTGRFEGNSIKT